MIHKKISLLNETTLESLKQTDRLVILEKFMEAGQKILNADFGWAWWKTGDKYSLAYKSSSTPYTPNYPRKRGGNYIAQKTNKPLFANDVMKKPYVIRRVVGRYMKAYVIIPIMFKENSYGNMVFCFKKRHTFAQQERSLCVALGNAAAQAITINHFIIREQEAWMESEKQRLRFRAMIENSYDVIALLDASGIITDISNSIKRMSGYEVNDLLGRNIAQFIHLDDVQKMQSHMQETLQQPNTSLIVEARYRHNDGSWHWLEASGINKLDDPSVNGIIANIRDVTERKEAEKTIMQQALQDSLTGLPNRQEFALRFSQALEQAKRHNRKFAVMFLDMDRFKDVNDRLGHTIGDALLKVVASRLAASVRAEDVAARFGGDEFLILINEVHSAKNIMVTAEKILKAVNLPVQIGNHTFHPSVSIGIAMYPDDGLDLEGLKKNADIALYRAKENGRNRFSLYDHSLNGLYQAERYTLENELREALLSEQITVYYQPIINLKRRKLIAVEALARWMHPQRGMLPPNEFISLAEDTGLIAELDKIVLKQACKQAKLWQEMGLPKFRISVNLSAQQFSEPEFVASIAGILAETGLDGNDLQLEITESLAMGNLELTNLNLKALKNLGVSITIDDFGTGYSSLNYLKRFPIHGLKIDKSFVRHCITNPADTSITKTIIAMAQTLNLKVVAEGVEGIQQLEFLRSLGCDGAQGFFIAKPMPAENFTGWFEANYLKKSITPASVSHEPQPVESL